MVKCAGEDGTDRQPRSILSKTLSSAEVLQTKEVLSTEAVGEEYQ
jgi:hypothetical protein